MIFHSDTKELWRYASNIYTAASDVRTANHQPPQQRPLLPPLLPPHCDHVNQRHQCNQPHQPQLQQQQRYEQQYEKQYGHHQNMQELSMPFYVNCCSRKSSAPTATSKPASEMAVGSRTNTPPPPPYCLVAGGTDSSDTSQPAQAGYTISSCQRPKYSSDVGAESSFCTVIGSRTNGSSCENYGDDMIVDESEQTNENITNSSTSSSFPRKETYHLQFQKQWCPTQMQQHQQQQQQQQQQPATTTFVNMFRNCCGRSCVGSTNINPNTNPSSNSITHIHTHNANINTNANAHAIKICYPTTQFQYPRNVSPESPLSHTRRQYFKALMKQLKSTQQSMLLKAIKSRADRPPTYRDMTHCILIPRAPILDEEPYVIACRLFLWPDLQSSALLKRLPVCPTERDTVYVCCNPLHWYRILETDTAPPPYQLQQPSMEKLKKEEPLSTNRNTQNGGNTSSITTSTSTSTSTTTSTIITNSNSFEYSKCHNSSANYSSSYYGVQSSISANPRESLTTDDEDRRRRSSTWCQVAYWELKQRVGEQHLARKSSINIFWDGAATGIGDDMYLKELAEKKSTPSPKDVQHIRTKIGLGVTLCKESDGVWLYNRSTETLFVCSPTLSESLLRVCRVEPGDCLNVFDSQRAQHRMNSPSVQLGPVDVFSIRISFAKGWGNKYKRQDITRCPCWLEVIFNQR